MRSIGIDLGSRAVKLVVSQDREIIENRIFDTFAFYRDYCRNKNNKISVDFENLDLKGFDKVVSTGYGRNNVNIDGAEVIVELKAHTFGAVRQTGLQDFTLLDIGGQDSKVISVRKGRMSDMILNDKCAASCGRYVENMAAVLGITTDEMGGFVNEPVELNSTCAVFGESELIGRISEGIPIERLAAGVNYSLFKRIKPLLERFPDEKLIVTGGVAKNKALLDYIKNETCFKSIIIPEQPQLNGAIGCCAFAERLVVI